MRLFMAGFMCGLLIAGLVLVPSVQSGTSTNWANLEYARDIHQAWLGYGSPHPLWDADWVAAYTALLEGTEDAPNIRARWEAGYYWEGDR